MIIIFSKIDSAIFYFINRGMQNSLFDTIMPFITHYENWYVIIGIFVCVTLFKNHRKAFIAISLTLLAIIISDFINHNVFKSFFGRIRPCKSLPDVRILAGCTGSFSFPSSHASNVSALSTVLACEYRKIAVFMVMIAVSVSYSRVYLGIHYPSDVIAGGISGALFGIGVIQLKKLDVFKNILRYEEFTEE